jgi:hypothetical protein
VGVSKALSPRRSARCWAPRQSFFHDTDRIGFAGVDLIPRLSDHDLLAQSRKPMDMIFHGWSMSLFQAPQQWSRMSSKDRKILFESQLSRMNCQTFSCGFNSGHLGAAG